MLDGLEVLGGGERVFAIDDRPEALGGVGVGAHDGAAVRGWRQRRLATAGARLVPWRWFAALVAAALITSACSGAPATDDDAGETADATTGEPPLASPEIPWLPLGEPTIAPPGLTPCPDGWTTMTSETGLVTCEPQIGRTDCGPGEANWVGSTECARVGPACPADGLPGDLPTDRAVVWVLASSVGGDGSRAAPHGTLADVDFSTLAPGTIVALGRGVYDDVAVMRPGIGLWGACAEETVLSPTTATTSRGAVFLAMAGEADVRQISIVNAARPGITVESDGAHLRLADVVVREANGFSVVAVDGARLTAERLVIRDTRAGPGDAFGHGLQARRGARIEARQVVVTGSVGIGVLSYDVGADLTLEDARVQDTESRIVDGLLGPGLWAELGGARLTARRVAVERSTSVGVLAQNGGELVLEDIVVRDTRTRPIDHIGGGGIKNEGTATLSAERVLVERTRSSAIESSGSTAALQDIVIRETANNNLDFGGRSLTFYGVGSVRRALVESGHELGVLAMGDAAHVTVEDLRVRDIAWAWSSARGISVQDGARLQVTRGALEDCGESGLSILGRSASVRMEDVVVRDTAQGGAHVQSGGAVELARVLVERAGYIGVGVLTPPDAPPDYDTRAVLEDVVIRDTRSSPPGSSPGDGITGRGILAQYAATVEARRASIPDSRETAVMSLGRGAHVLLEDVEIRGVLPPACLARAQCGLLGVGLGSYRGGAMMATCFSVADAEVCGVHVAASGAMDLSDGVVSGSEIGACIQVDGYDVARLSREVRFLDNGVGLQATTLPVPEPVATLGS